MKNLCVMMIFLMISHTLAGCFAEEYGGDDYTQEKMDLYVYEDGELALEIGSCPYLPRPAVTEPIFIEATNIRPFDAVNDDGQFEIYEPSDLTGKFVVVYLDSPLETDFLMAPWLKFFENKGAAGVIFSILAHGRSGVENKKCDDITYLKASKDAVKGTSADGLTIPIIQISPNSMRDLIKIDSPWIEIGPDGFEPTGWPPQSSETPSSVLPTQKISKWVEGHEQCTGDDIGAVVHETQEDTNQDGIYQANENIIEIECRPNSPYGDNHSRSIYNIVDIETSTSECTSGLKFRVDTLVEYQNGSVETIEGTSYICTGLDSESFDAQLKRTLCDSGEILSEEEIEAVSIRECLSPGYESELLRVIPQVRIQSVSSDQMPSCPNGGLLIETWVDSDGNGAWKQSETQSMQSVCNGIDGADGSDGQDGMDAYDFLSDDIPFLSNGECGDAEGGREVVMGRDINDNGLLDADEVEHSYSVCNGQPGENGSDGHSAVVNITSFSSPACNGVYVRLANGFDYDNDSSLSTEETLGSRYICLPSQQTNTNATFVKESIEPNSVCLNGGIHTYIWIDENGDNIVQNSNNSSEVFMESYDCAEDEDVVQCSDSDGDCISDENDMSEENDRESFPDADDDGVPDHEDQCDGQDDTIDFDGSGIPDCLEDYY